MTRFVDVHVHPPLAALVEGAETPLTAADWIDGAPGTIEELADYYRTRDGIAVVHAFDAETTTGLRAIANHRLAELVAAHPDVLVGLGSVDPHRGAAAVGDVADAKRLGLGGLFFHPPAQRFDPASRLATPLWEMAADLQLPVVIHSGTTVLGSGALGGGGVRLDRADPLRIDAVAAAHPTLKIVMIHPTPPWEQHAVAVTRHKGNVWLALPSRALGDPTSPLRELLSDLLPRVVCGTGFPLSEADDWLTGWDALGLAEEISRATLVGNASELFGLEV